MFQRLRESFKNNPTLYYSASIAATWAGAGALIVGMRMVQDYGVIPFLLWALGNTLACIVFGLFANRFKYVRKVFTSKIAKTFIGFMCVFQIWTNMSGVNDALVNFNPMISAIGTYAIAIGFMFFFLKRGTMRVVLTDDASWKLNYLLIAALALFSLCINGFNVPSLGLEREGMMSGLTKCMTLIPGAFFYPVFWEMFDYNDENKDGTCNVNMQHCFIYGGLLFGVFLAFVLLVSCTSFTPALEVLKCVLIAIVAADSLIAFVYSMFVSFGIKGGLIMNIFSFIGWYALIPLGVMKIWTAMQNVRFSLVIVAMIAAFVWSHIDRRRNVH